MVKKYLAFVIIVVLSTACKPTTEQMMNEGNNLLDQGDNVGAIKIFSTVIEQNNKLQDAYYDRSLCYSNMKEYHKALMDLNKISEMQGDGPLLLVINPDSPLATEEDKAQVPRMTVLFERAKVEYFMDSLKSSFIDFQTCLNNDYQKSKCYLWIGTIHIKSGNKIKGCALYEKARFFGDEEIEKMIKGNCN